MEGRNAVIVRSTRQPRTYLPGCTAARASRTASPMAAPRLPVVEVTELTDDVICLTLSKTDSSIANAMRRVMLCEVALNTTPLAFCSHS